MTSAWLVHLYTASGAVCAFLALSHIAYDRYRDAFFWLIVAVVVDATDGLMARRVDVKTKTPHFDGALLDNIVDYLTYVFVPAYFAWHALLVVDPWAMPVAAAMLLSSAYGFSHDRAKTSDHFFTGFPSYWNIVVFYLWLAGTRPAFNAGLLLALAALVFVPVRYVYPSRTPVLMTLTNVLGVIWGGLMVALWWQAPETNPVVFGLSLVFPAYYTGLSAVLEYRRRQTAGK